MPARRFTTTFAAVEGLYNAILARGLTDVQVEWGWPGENAVGGELIWIGNVEMADQDAAAIGQGRRDERYTISVYVDVAMKVTELADVGRRTAELVREVEAAVHNDPQLGGGLPSDGWAQIGDVEPGPTIPVGDGVHNNVARVRVACRARI